MKSFQQFHLKMSAILLVLANSISCGSQQAYTKNSSVHEISNSPINAPAQSNSTSEPYSISGPAVNTPKTIGEKPVKPKK